MPRLSVPVLALTILAVMASVPYGPTLAFAECSESKLEECEWPEKPEGEPTEGEWPKEEGSSKEEEEAGRDPILFVHGYNGYVTTFKTFVKWFKEDGWPLSRLHNWAYNSAQSNVTTAKEISKMVDKLREITGATKVDIITHSMGALASRYYIKNLGGAAKVDDWISLGGPNHGTNLANFCFTTACVEMRPNSAFLNALNQEETPGEVSYTTWRTLTGCDNTITPAESVELVGAVNIILEKCVSHVNLHETKSIYEEVREWVIF